MIPNTFGINATADQVVAIQNESHLQEVLASGTIGRLPHLVVGGGSNLVFTRPFPGVVLLMQNKGVAVLAEDPLERKVSVKVSAGEILDDFVHLAVARGWHGMENLVAIPGTVGAAPVQNVGAYGVEAKDVVQEVNAYEIATGKKRIFSNADCRFGYRDSVFKHEFKDLYVVESVVFSLSLDFDPNLNYAALASLEKPVTPESLVEGIANLRWSKLPRPEEIGSAGSFFKNPIVTASHFEKLKSEYPDIVAYPAGDGFKLAAGWLIEHSGWKGKNLGKCGVYEKQALVLVNRGGCTGEDVLRLASAVEADVQAKFGVLLEKEAIIV
ncbi:MAG: UDP-N-acetylmuramate dehydrogenase [Bacteroidales bacterium]|nr:UDP-N-acetylmuramate dehydrogenase [Candidatus Colimorpha pelethequi]